MEVEVGRPGLLNSRKFKRFCAIMQEADDLPPSYCLGLIEHMWQSHSYVEGDAILGDALGVKMATGYPGSADVIVRALMSAGAPDKAGFIEEVPGSTGLFQVHDLDENAPAYVKRRAKRTADRKRSGLKDDDDGPAPDDLRQLWNELAGPAGLPTRKAFSGNQAAKAVAATARARLREHPNMDEWRTVIGRILARPFCLGKNDKGWRATFDYLCRVKTFDDHFEGKFAHLTPVTKETLVGSGVDAEHVVMRLETLADKLGAIGLKWKSDEPKAADILERGMQALLDLRGDRIDMIEKSLFQIEGVLLDGLFKAHSDHAGLEAKFEAQAKETGGKLEVWRDKWVRKTFELPHLNLD